MDAMLVKVIIGVVLAGVVMVLAAQEIKTISAEERSRENELKKIEQGCA